MMVDWRSIFVKKDEASKQRRAERSRELNETRRKADEISVHTKNIVDFADQLIKKKKNG
jgi:hypothetical protein